jgi:DNA-binding HxlR family transcriptional regulator
LKWNLVRHARRNTPRGGDDVDFARLRQVSALFSYQWDPFVIASLAVNGPLRFGQLGFKVTRNSGARLADSTLTEIKDRLIRAGLVEATDDGKGHPLYQLTAAGRAKADVIQAITDAVPDEDTDRQRSST